MDLEQFCLIATAAPRNAAQQSLSLGEIRDAAHLISQMPCSSLLTLATYFTL